MSTSLCLLFLSRFLIFPCFLCSPCSLCYCIPLEPYLASGYIPLFPLFHVLMFMFSCPSVPQIYCHQFNVHLFLLFLLFIPFLLFCHVYPSLFPYSPCFPRLLPCSLCPSYLYMCDLLSCTVCVKSHDHCIIIRLCPSHSEPPPPHTYTYNSIMRLYRIAPNVQGANFLFDLQPQNLVREYVHICIISHDIYGIRENCFCKI